VEWVPRCSREGVHDVGEYLAARIASNPAWSALNKQDESGKPILDWTSGQMSSLLGQ
jgi:hypothetical protein